MLSGLEKFGYMLGTMACQLQAIAMFSSPGFGGTNTSDGQTVLAFTILAFFILITCQYLILEALFSELVGHKIANILIVVGLFVAPICILIAVAVYPSISGSSVKAFAFTYTTMVTAMGAAPLGGVFVLIGTLCSCGGSST